MSGLPLQKMGNVTEYKSPWENSQLQELCMNACGQWGRKKGQVG